MTEVNRESAHDWRIRPGSFPELERAAVRDPSARAAFGGSQQSFDESRCRDVVGVEVDDPGLAQGIDTDIPRRRWPLGGRVPDEAEAEFACHPADLPTRRTIIDHHDLDVGRLRGERQQRVAKVST
jgi:hypothetical protein